MNRGGVFESILCGVDETPASLDAVRQAVRLREPGGKVHLFSAVNLAPAYLVAWSAPRLVDELEREAGEALERALELVPDATRHLVAGRPVASLLEEIERERSTLVAVGTHGTGRPEGILLGGVATTLLHEAPCAVLVARPAPDLERFPRSLLVGIDGSPESAVALRAAVELRQRLDGELHALVALGGKEVDLEAARKLAPSLEVDRVRSPVHALVEASRGVDLLVLGSRGLHGIRALGSVSERAAHRAQCSVLVARTRG